MCKINFIFGFFKHNLLKIGKYKRAIVVLSCLVFELVIKPKCVTLVPKLSRNLEFISHNTTCVGTTCNIIPVIEISYSHIASYYLCSTTERVSYKRAKENEVSA